MGVSFVVKPKKADTRDGEDLLIGLGTVPLNFGHRAAGRGEGRDRTAWRLSPCPPSLVNRAGYPILVAGPG